jgi:hypothetical protein
MFNENLLVVIFRDYPMNPNLIYTNEILVIS